MHSLFILKINPSFHFTRNGGTLNLPSIQFIQHMRLWGFRTRRWHTSELSPELPRRMSQRLLTYRCLAGNISTTPDAARKAPRRRCWPLGTLGYGTLTGPSSSRSQPLQGPSTGESAPFSLETETHWNRKRKSLPPPSHVPSGLPTDHMEQCVCWQRRTIHKAHAHLHSDRASRGGWIWSLDATNRIN